ncbi:Protein F52B5.3 [Aphelenchoides avenae]|nr:Protein F52B5.3 [Aphelenchus avenae]
MFSRRGRGGHQRSHANFTSMFEQRIYDKLVTFSESKETELKLDAMTREERKLTHNLARKLELRSISRGVEPNRYMTIMRQRPRGHLFSLTNETESIQLLPEQKQAIRGYLQEFPIEPKHVEDHLSLPDTRKRTQKSDNMFRAEKLVPPYPTMTAEIEQFRMRLPTFPLRSTILSNIREKQVTLITGGTGCGKTTQVPQFILEEAVEKGIPIRITCTQPRRLPAIAVSDRVAKERGERLGCTVGYHIRLEQKTSPKTVLTYCTSGVLLRMLTVDELAKDVSHIILDEIHEREQNTDYLLIALKQALKKRHDLKVILMSATMEGNLETFMSYFAEFNVGHVDIPSRLHNVEKFYLSEVLAMTGYMPSNDFGGMFQSSNLFTSKFDSFPTVGQFNEDNAPKSELHSVRTAPNALSTYAQHDGYQSSQDWGAYQKPYPQQQQQQQNFYANAHQYPVGSAGHFNHPGHSSTSNLHERYSVPPTTTLASTSGTATVAPSSSSFSQVSSDTYQQQQKATTASNGTTDAQYSTAQYPSANGQQAQYAYNQQYAAKPSTAQPSDAQRDGRLYTFGGPPPATPDRLAHWTANAKFYVSTDGQEAMNENYRSFGQTSSTQFGNQSFPSSGDFGGGWSRLNNVFAEAARHLDNVLPDRPNYFDPTFTERLKKANLHDDALIRAYLNSGGQQWAESVDPDLTVATIKYCLDSPVDGSVLVFLPGYDDILTIRERLIDANDTQTKPMVFTLHSQMNSQDQQRVFESAPRGQRKVILSTNIAEASLTIDDVVFVIDGGKVKEKTYDHSNRISQLKVAWIAKSNAEQRSGRAGRCRNGFCFRLYSSKDYADMSLAQMAEMKRAAIHDVCLHAKMFAPDNMSVKAFLELAPEPPSPAAVERSLEFLEQLGALYSDSASRFAGTLFGPREKVIKEPELTELGRLIAHLPLDPQLARLLLFGLALKCFNPVITLVSALSHRDPFILPLGEDKTNALLARDEFARRDFSDHLMLIRAFYEYNKVKPTNQYQFCRKNFLSPTTMKMIQGIRRQLMLELRRIRLIPSHVSNFDDAELNTYSHCWPMVQAAIVAGCYPGIAFVRAGSKLRKIRTSLDVNASLHPSSVIKRQLMPPAKRFDSKNSGYGCGDGEPVIEYLAYQELSKIDEGLTLRTVTITPPLTVMIFAGSIRMRNDIIEDFELAEEDFSSEASAPEEKDDEQGASAFGYVRENVVDLEPWLAFRGITENLQLAMKLRFKVMSYFLSVLKNPMRETTTEDEILLSCLSDVLIMDHKRFGFNECIDLPKAKATFRQPPRSRDVTSNSSFQSSYSSQDVRKYQNDRPEVGSSYSYNSSCNSSAYEPQHGYNGAAQSYNYGNRSRDNGNGSNTSHQSGAAQRPYGTSWQRPGNVSQQEQYEDEIPEDPCTTPTTERDEMSQSASGMLLQATPPPTSDYFRRATEQRTEHEARRPHVVPSDAQRSNYNPRSSTRSNSSYARNQNAADDAPNDNGADWRRREQPVRDASSTYQPNYGSQDNRRYPKNSAENNWSKKSQSTSSSFDGVEKRPAPNRGNFGFARANSTGYANNAPYQKNDRRPDGFSNASDAPHNRYPQRTPSSRYSKNDHIEEGYEEQYETDRRPTPANDRYNSDPRRASADEEEARNWRRREEQSGNGDRYNNDYEKGWNDRNRDDYRASNANDNRYSRGAGRFNERSAAGTGGHAQPPRQWVNQNFHYNNDGAHSSRGRGGFVRAGGRAAVSASGGDQSRSDQSHSDNGHFRNHNPRNAHGGHQEGRTFGFVHSKQEARDNDDHDTDIFPGHGQYLSNQRSSNDGDRRGGRPMIFRRHGGSGRQAGNSHHQRD